MTSLVDRAAGLLASRSDRRGFLARAAVVGSAMAVGPWGFLTRPGTAYAAVCGVDATCSSGYTVFCATINGGTNRCPPGSLVGGWWKSDGSGFCCGNARYYIDCHSFCSCGCGGGSNFCGEGCRNCSCGCGPSGQCDQRKVCCNNFRYGQCNQDVSCTGPVWCRVVTCTPPWRIPAWKCTTTSATDQRTNSHGAPSLEDCTPIGSKYTSLGGPGGFLGEARTGEQAQPGGARTLYDFGAIYFSGATGAHEVHGAIGARYDALGGPTSPLGYPSTDELPTPDGRGRYNDFAGPGGTGATIIHSPETGSHAVYGSIKTKWNELGSQAGPLGYPTTSELPTGDGRGRYNDFVGPGGAGGTIVHSPSTGSRAVMGDIKAKWNELGSQSGTLGYPTTDEQRTPDGRGRYNDFVGPGGGGATIISTPATGAHAVYGAIKGLWNQLGSQAGPLGYPTTDELAAPGGTGRYNDFTGGSVYWSAATDAHSVRGAIRTAWLERGGASGSLRLPTTEASTADGRERQEFQGGTITRDTSTGQITVTPR